MIKMMMMGSGSCTIYQNWSSNLMIQFLVVPENGKSYGAE